MLSLQKNISGTIKSIAGDRTRFITFRKVKEEIITCLEKKEATYFNNEKENDTNKTDGRKGGFNELQEEEEEEDHHK